jgi:DNA recombination protein RmuC
MRKHYQDLAGKDYAQIVSNGRSIPFTLMFVPIEAAGIEAFRVAPDLFIEAQKRKIIMVTPTTLFCVLQLVSALWNIHDRQANSMKIAEQGRLLLRKLGSFVGSFKSVGDSLAHAAVTYEKAKDQLQAGKGNLVSVAERMAKLGVEAPREGELARLIESGETDISEVVLPGSGEPRLSDVSA